MATAVKKKKVPSDVFIESVLPTLRKKYADNATLKAAIVSEYELYGTDDAGNDVAVELDISTLIPDPAGSDVPPVEQAAMEETVKRLINDAVTKKGAAPLFDIKVTDRADSDPKAGFKSFGEFSRSVKNWATRRGMPDERLERAQKAAPAGYMGEAVGADGGFLIPTDFRTEIMSIATGTTAILPLTNNLTTQSNSVTIPVDESTPANPGNYSAANGIRAFWTDEAAEKLGSKPQVRRVQVDLYKLTALVKVSDEMLEDTFLGLNQLLSRKAGEAIMEECNSAFVRGNGVGQPLGYRNSPVMAIVAKESGQTADTVNVANLSKMFAALTPGSMSNARWMHHSTVFPQLVQTTIGQQPAYVAPGGLPNAPAGTVFGRPLIISQDMNPVGDQGDIDLVDWSQYLTLTKTTGIQEAMSIHLHFDYNVTTFRFEFRVGGRPWMSKPITQKDGVTTNSPFVTLADRA